MRQIGEVLRLAAQHLSYHQIAQSVGISRTSVHNYLKRAQQAGLNWPLPEELDEAAVEARLFTRSEEASRSGRPEPNWLEVHREHKRGKHVTLQLLHLEYKAVHPDGWGYTQFCAHYRRRLGRRQAQLAGHRTHWRWQELRGLRVGARGHSAWPHGAVPAHAAPAGGTGAQPW
jgi:AcrR family transcriptional regulator